ncbi:hypothetical protein [Vannielia litorea]|uniref:hypothetical protein n=1 Tax=Vannielia litorea TaxID=1217970 RepID=UPI001BD19586|nr:hypothetical protein [Vannielia litorea]MBS8228574.1 hypothetical protein [Vannielia litorea]
MKQRGPIASLRHNAYGTFLRQRVWLWRQLHQAGLFGIYFVGSLFFLWVMLPTLGAILVLIVIAYVFQSPIPLSLWAILAVQAGYLIFARKIVVLILHDFFAGYFDVVRQTLNRPSYAATHLAKAEARLSEWKTAA